MFKVMVFMKRKPGISREEFIEYYEKYHQKLAREILPVIPDYRRSYPVYDDSFNYSGSFDGSDDQLASRDQVGMAGDEFDVIMELWFHGRAEFARFTDVVRSPGIAEKIAADEDQFMERSGNRRVLVVEEYRSPPNGTIDVEYS